MKCDTKIWKRSRVKDLEKNPGINQGNQAARGSQERNHWPQVSTDSHWLSMTQRIFIEADVRENPDLYAEDSKALRNRRNCRKLQRHVWSVDRFTQTNCCHVENGPTSPKVPVFQQKLHICMCSKSSKSSCFLKCHTAHNVQVKQEAW